MEGFSLGALLCNIVSIYRYILFARVIISFIPLFAPTWSPPQGLRPVFDFIYGLTDPPIDLIRRFVPQPSGFPLDISFMIWFLLVVIVIRPAVCVIG
ncbi:MAG: YggT family protein [Actinomycetota bacterium]